MKLKLRGKMVILAVIAVSSFYTYAETDIKLKIVGKTKCLNEKVVFDTDKVSLAFIFKKIKGISKSEPYKINFNEDEYKSYIDRESKEVYLQSDLLKEKIVLGKYETNQLSCKYYTNKVEVVGVTFNIKKAKSSLCHPTPEMHYIFPYLSSTRTLTHKFTLQTVEGRTLNSKLKTEVGYNSYFYDGCLHKKNVRYKNSELYFSED